METILVATDFSPAASNAVDYAVELTKFFDARLVLLNAYPIPPANYDAGFSIDIIAESQKAALKKLEDLKDGLLLKSEQHIEIDCVVEIGPPEDVVTAVSNRMEVDLIVMGIVGEAGPFKEHLIGSTAVAVARHVDTPTFIIPEKARYRPIRKISFACDLDHTEETTLVHVAKYFSQMFDAELEVINIERPEEEVSFEKAKSSVFVERKLENTQHKTVYVTETDVARGLEGYLLSHPTDLVIVSPKKHNFFRNLFTESVTKELAFHLHQPILAIH